MPSESVLNAPPDIQTGFERLRKVCRNYRRSIIKGSPLSPCTTSASRAICRICSLSMTIHCRPVHQQFRRSLAGGNGRRRYRAGAQPLGFRRPQGRKAGAPASRYFHSQSSGLLPSLLRRKLQFTAGVCVSGVDEGRRARGLLIQEVRIMKVVFFDIDGISVVDASQT